MFYVYSLLPVPDLFSVKRHRKLPAPFPPLPPPLSHPPSLASTPSRTACSPSLKSSKTRPPPFPLPCKRPSITRPRRSSPKSPRFNNPTLTLRLRFRLPSMTSRQLSLKKIFLSRRRYRWSVRRCRIVSPLYWT